MGSFAISTTSTNDITARIEWSESNVSISNNTSDLNVKLIYRMNASKYATLGSGYFKITVNGTAYENNQYVTFASGTHEYTVIDHTFTITHDANGAKSVSIVVNNGYVAGTTGLSASSGSGTATLTTIARASQPTATNTTYGSATTVTTNRASSSFTHTLTFTQGSSLTQTVTGVGASYTWTVPTNWASAISASATSTTIAVTCTTYNGSTAIGTKSTTFTVSIPASWKPTVSITPTYSSIGSNNKVLANVTSVRLDASATATSGSTISSYAWSGSASGTASYYSFTPSTTGTFTYTVTVTDARGRTNSASISITVYDPVSTFTVASSVNFGEELGVSIARAKSTFTHVVRYYINSTHTTDVNDNNNAWTSFTIPASWAEVVPTSSSATMVITCTTYNGSTALGSRTANVTVVVPSSWKPTFTVTAEAINGFNSLNLKGVTKVKYTVASASPSTGSQIQTISFTGNNLNKTVTTTSSSATATSDLLSVVGSNTYTIKVTDKRGRVTTKTSTLTVTDYSPPTIKLSVGRYDSGGTADNFGAYGRMVATGSWVAVSGNSWTLTLKQKKKTASSYTTVNTWSSQTASSVSKTSDLFTADVDSAYDCQATITDAVGKSATMTIALSTGKAIMDWFKDKVVAVFSTASDTLRQLFSNPSTLFFSNADKNVLNGEVLVPASGTDGMTNGFTYLRQAMLNRYGIQYSDFNSYTESGMYWINPDATPTNNPTAGYGFLVVYNIRDGVIHQKFTPYNTSNGYLEYTRTYANSQWYNWASNRTIPTPLNILYGDDTKISLYGNSEGGNIREYAPDGSYVEMDQYNSSSWRIYAANASGVYMGALSWDKSTNVNLSQCWTKANSLKNWAASSSSMSLATDTVTVLATVSPGAAGRYLVATDVNFSTASTTICNLYVATLNSSGSVLEERYIRNSQAAGGGMSMTYMRVLTATDKIRIRVYQSSGAATTVRYRYQIINLGENP